MTLRDHFSEEALAAEQAATAERRERLRNEVNKKHGEIIIPATRITEKERKIISISPMADYNLNGGVPEGSWLLLSGPPKCGKTVTALQIAANAQKQYGKPVYFGAVEHRLEKKELEGIHGLDIEDVEAIQSYEGKILNAQDFLQEFTTVIKDVPGCILIIDSTSALCAEGEFASEIKSQGRNEGPKLLATFCRRMAPVVPVNRALVIVIQHLIANTSGYGEPYYEDGGKKMQYQGDTKLRCTTVQKWENAKKDDQIGQVLNWQIKTAALTKPGRKFQSYLRYGYGLDDIKEYMCLGLDMGLIDKKGAWYSYAGQRAQGEEKLRQLFVDSPEHLTTLKNQIEQML
jgi:recombination protein RecA